MRRAMVMTGLHRSVPWRQKMIQYIMIIIMEFIFCSSDAIAIRNRGGDQSTRKS